MRAPRLYGNWACSSSAACAEWKNVAAKFRALVPPTTTSVRSRVLNTVAAARPTSDRFDRRARRLRVETALGTAHAAPAAGFDDDVSDLAGVAGRAVEQVA